MRGIRNDVQKKISRLRSRSAERISQRNQGWNEIKLSTESKGLDPNLGEQRLKINA
jgi:hypothetical protein